MSSHGVRPTTQTRSNKPARGRLAGLIGAAVVTAGTLTAATVTLSYPAAAAVSTQAADTAPTLPPTNPASSASAKISTSQKPGTLISATPFAAGVRTADAYRVRYVSQAVNGSPIEVTGLAFLPKLAPPKGGWPVLSFAHGTVGLADRCAPSAATKLGSVESALAGFLTATGFAVVQTDYEGLGTPGRHPYLNGESEGRGVLDIVRAAQQIKPSTLSKRTIVWGHSQGGHAALFAGEIAKTWAPELQLLGVIAGAPPSQLTNIADSIENSPYRGYLFMVAAGLNAADPSLPLEKALTQKGLDTLGVVDTGCNSQVFKAFASGPLDDYVQRTALTESPWRDALLANEPGNRKIPAPVLIIHGDKDEQIPVQTSATLRTKMCKLGMSVDRKVYRNADHGGAALVSLFDVSAWIAQRVAGTKPTSSCPK
jgi:pimeloyl-ACP methyl ester carboxylesterase